MTRYYFIRHCEKESAFHRDPSLSEKGKKRAVFWSEYFEDKNIDLVYCTALKRTQETAYPLLKKLNLPFVLYNPSNLDLNSFLRETKNKNSLIVGHQDTTPSFVNLLIKQNKYTFISSREFSNLYSVVMDDEKLVSSELKCVKFNQI